MKKALHEVSTECKDESTEYKGKSTEYKDKRTEYKGESTEYKDEWTEYKDESTEYNEVSTTYKEKCIIIQLWHSIVADTDTFVKIFFVVARFTIHESNQYGNIHECGLCCVPSRKI